MFEHRQSLNQTDMSERMQGNQLCCVVLCCAFDAGMWFKLNWGDRSATLISFLFHVLSRELSLIACGQYVNWKKARIRHDRKSESWWWILLSFAAIAIIHQLMILKSCVLWMNMKCTEVWARICVLLHCKRCIRRERHDPENGELCTVRNGYLNVRLMIVTDSWHKCCCILYLYTIAVGRERFHSMCVSPVNYWLSIDYDKEKQCSVFNDFPF